jgi:O-antigen/teichoic acid export membrane protein
LTNAHKSSDNHQTVGTKRDPRGLSQRGRLKFLLKDSIVFGGASALSKGFAFITFPVIARHFTTAEYGLIDFLGVFGTFLAVLIVFGQDSSVARFYYEYEDTNSRRQLISQSLVFQLVLSMVLLPCLWLGASAIWKFVPSDRESSDLLKIVILQAPFLVLFNFSQNLLKWTFQRNLFLVVSLGSVFATVFLIVLGITVFEITMMEFLQLGLLIRIVFALLGIWFIRKWLTIPKGFKYLRNLIPYALPLGIICSAGAFMPNFTRWVTIDLFGEEKLGLYAMGSRIAMILLLFTGAFHTAWGPFSLSIHKEKNAIHTYNLVLKCFVFAMVLFAIALAALAYPLIVLLATQRYEIAAFVVFPLALGVVVDATGLIASIGIGLSKRTFLNLYAFVIYFCLTICFIYAFSSLGFVGVAMAVLCGFLTKTLFLTWFAQRNYPLAWNFKGITIFLLISILYGFCALGIMRQQTLAWGSFTFAVGLVFLALGGFVFLFTQSERRKISQFIHAKVGSCLHAK